MPGSHAAQGNSAGAELRVGQVVPDTASLHALPNGLSNQVPEINAYKYTMLHNQVLIVDPSTKRIIAIIAD